MKKWMETGGGGVSIFIMEFQGYGRIMQFGNSEGKGRRGGGVQNMEVIHGMDIFWNHPFSDTYKTYW